MNNNDFLSPDIDLNGQVEANPNHSYGFGNSLKDDLFDVPVDSNF